jgi:hypothetical protein
MQHDLTKIKRLTPERLSTRNTKTVRPLWYGNTITTTRKANQMNELALEQITKTKCLVCGDKLAPFELESQLCIMCED